MTDRIPVAVSFVTAWFLNQFCNCCGDGCDCGCVLECQVSSHRERAGV